MYKQFAILAIFTFLYSLISGRIKNLPISGPIIFVLVGLVVGPFGLGWFKGDISRDVYRVLVDLTLTLVLFIDAANADISVLRRQVALPTRMLLLGLPGTILLGFFFAWVLFDGLTLYEMAILATMLAATDAALGKPVVTNEMILPRLREGLNCESGLNDGLCVPILLVFIALAHGQTETSALTLVAKEIGIGAIVGLAVTGGGAWLLKLSARSGWVSEVWVQVSVPSLALACFAIAQSLHGSGYIAAFTGGMLFGSLAKQAKHQLEPGPDDLADFRNCHHLAKSPILYHGDHPLFDFQSHSDSHGAHVPGPNRHRRTHTPQAVSWLVWSEGSRQYRFCHYRH